MRALLKKFEIDTIEKIDVVDITEELQKEIKKLKISNGIACIYSMHTTSAITVNENEEGLIKDIKRFLEAKAPVKKQYEHDEMEKRDVPVDEPVNGHSHIKAMILGSSVSIPIANSRLYLGKWQKLFFVDCDGPRHRSFCMQIIE